MTELTLRPYQLESIEAVEQAWMRGVQRPAIVLPTGAGKTVVFSRIASRWVEANRMSAKQRVLVLAHREELIEQAAAKIRLMAPHLRVGIVKADRDNCTAEVIVASVPTLRNIKRRNRIVHVGLLVVDECHHGVAQTYRLIMEHYGCFNEGGARALGVTATMSRTDEMALGDVWQEVVYVKDVAEMVAGGYLVRPRGKLLKVDDLDLAKVRKTAGDFADGALGTALENSLAPRAVASGYLEHAADRQGILFAPTVHCAGVYGEALADQGFKSELVHGALASGARRDALERFRQGDTQILVNCMVLTEGTDLPMASAIVVGRPTKSQGLFVQMVGRGLRLWPGKEDALVLIVAGKAVKHSLSTPVELFGETLDELETEEREAIEAVELDPLDETLIEAPGKSEPELPEFADGNVISVDVDLFRRSKSAWQQTERGIWFLPAGPGWFIVIRPQGNGMWGVVRCEQTGRRSQWVIDDAPDMAYAMAFAEANVSKDEKAFDKAWARWKQQSPTKAMLAEAHELGIAVMSYSIAGELNKMILKARASRRIDPWVPTWR